MKNPIAPAQEKLENLPNLVERSAKMKASIHRVHSEMIG